ncbi:MAG: ABC transporter permease [Acidobacteria bacterium]|nr:ABC transporter permease [Acidobacteriota bacterium]MCW5969094.1 ABC transporter permease [Blastocatellales bacterium]
MRGRENIVRLRLRAGGLLSTEHQVLALCLIWFLSSIPFTPGLTSSNNISNIFSNLLPLLIVASGQTVVLITGGIDLSAPSVMGLAAVVGALVMSGDQGLLGGSAWAAPAGLAAMMLAGALVGWLNGAAITRLGMPPFIVTLTTMTFFSGLAVRLTKSEPIYNLPAVFTSIGKGSLFYIPYALFATVFLVGAMHVLLSRSLPGRWLYACGHNVRAAAISGVPVGATVTLAYTLSGVCAAAASVLYTGRLETGSPVLGQRLLLDVIGAAVIGGASLFGGRGKIVWTFYGVLFLTLIDNTLNLTGHSHFTIMMVKGGVILLAALLDASRRR